MNAMKKTNNQLPTDVKKLQDLLLEARSLLVEKDAKINTLLEQLKLSRAQRFASSSEKQNPQQGELFDEAEQIISSESSEDKTLVDNEISTRDDKAATPKPKKRGRSILPAHSC